MNTQTTPSTDDELLGRVILVTGASRGIGRAVALACADRGATLVLFGRDDARLSEVYDEIESHGGPEPAAVPLDFATATARQFDEAVGAVARTLGRIDGIVHCAGHTEKLAPVDSIDLDTWLQLARVNWLAPLALTRACLPILKASEDASVVYTLDSHVRTPGAWWGGVVAPRAALESAMQAQAEEWAVHPNLRVNAVVPGPVASPSRKVTHPGENAESVPAIETVVPTYLRLVGPGGRGTTGQIVDAAAG